MNAVLTATPPATQAAILRRVLDEAYPKLALPAIASNYGLTIVDLQAILHRHGYPDPVQMRGAVIALEEEHATATAEISTDDGLTTVYTTVPATKLLTDPNNPREHLDDIVELADSIRSEGLLQPIVARRDGERLYVVAGHRRLAALRHLKWTEVPVIIRPPMAPDDVLAAMLIENGQRTDLDPIEEARAYARLVANGLSHTEIGDRVGRSAATVAGRLALLDLPLEEQEEIRAGVLTLNYVNGRARLQRQQQRLRAGGRSVGRPKGATTKPYFGDTHPLAKDVMATCAHRGRPKVSGIGCGECWEEAIRADERRTLVDETRSEA